MQNYLFNRYAKEKICWEKEVLIRLGFDFFKDFLKIYTKQNCCSLYNINSEFWYGKKRDKKVKFENIRLADK